MGLAVLPGRGSINQGITVIGEVVSRPRLALFAQKGVTLEDVKEVYAELNTFDQTRQCWGGDVQQLRMASVTDACARARASRVAAVVAPGDEEIADLTVLVPDIQLPNAALRSLIVGRAEQAGWIAASGNDRTMVAFNLANRHGALLQALTAFEARGLNLAAVSSHPTPGNSDLQSSVVASYDFLLEVEGHTDAAEVKAAVADLQKSCNMVNILGSYPRAPR